MRSITPEGLALIKEYEGFKSKPYLDAVSKPTIGYGATHYADGTPVTIKDAPISQDQASLLLQELLNTEFCPKVEKLIKVPVTDQQFSAVVCFTYNLGAHNLEQSTLLSCLNHKNYNDAAEQFGKWVKAGGQTLPGLVRRRAAEKALFLSK